MTQIISSKGGGGGVGLYKFKGSVQTYNDLPTSGMKVGDVYNVVEKHSTAPKFPAGSNLAWTGTAWDVLGGDFDLSDYQEKLVEGTGIDIDQTTNEISVEDSIVNGAAAGATALQPGDNVSCLVNDAGYAKSCDLATVATSGEYCDLSGTPSIGDGLVTICRNSVCVNSFTLNQSSCSGIDISVPVNTSDLCNDSGYIDNTVNNLQNYTLSSNLCTVATSGKYCDLSGTPNLCTVATSGKYCDLSGLPTIPTDNCQLSNGCGYAKANTLCTVATSGKYCDLTGTPNLCTVATSGQYCDLTGTPTIPTDNCQLANGCGYTTCTGTLVASDLTPYAKTCDLATVATSGKYCDLTGQPTIPAVVDSLCCTSTTKALSANQGKQLKDLIDTYVGLGRFLSLWNSKTGQPISFPLSTPYTYKTGDWFMVEVVDSTTNYMPNGASYTGAASTTVDSTNNVEVRDVYIYDGTDWLFQKNNEIQVSFSDIAGVPNDNACLCAALAGKQDTACMVCNLSGADNSHYPSAKAVADALSCAGAGDMLSSVYDPCNKCSNAFDYCNFINTPTIPTDNCQLANSCGYTTCTGDVYNTTTASGGLGICGTTTVQGTSIGSTSLACSMSTALGFSARVSSTQSIGIGHGATGGTNAKKSIVIGEQANICCVGAIQLGAHGTNNETGSFCVSLGSGECVDCFTNYKLLGSDGIIPNARLDLSCYACCCDIPTNNNQLTNGCGYTTCTGTLVASDLTPYAKSCTLCTVATSGKYCDLTGQPTIGSASLSICRNGTLVNSFSANATSNVSVDISVPTNTCELTNGAGFTTCTGTLTSSNISDAAYASSWNGVTTVAPSKNAVYDKISSMDTTISGKQATLVSGTNIKTINNESILGSGNLTITGGGAYYAGDGIEITEHSDMQGPCPDGFHIPTKDEWVALYGILISTFGMGSNADTLGTYLKMPKAGIRSGSSSSVGDVNLNGGYWSSTASSADRAYSFYFYTSSINPQSDSTRRTGFSVRCFKDAPVNPDSSWTTLYDGSSVAAGAGVFYNATDGLISVSGDGVTWYTIMDKNLGATTVYNQGDTLTDANCGNFYQWGNNYGFPHSGTVTTSSTKVDVTGYGPGNYYSSSTFITVNPRNSTTNDNLWGGVTGVIHDAITNTGVLSVNGQTGDVTTHSTTTATLTSAGWSSKSQTVSVTGVTASNTVIVSPAPSSIGDYADGGVYASAQGSGTLTFTADTEPTNDITVNVLIMS